MIHITDKFLTEESFKLLQKYCSDNKFEIKKAGKKEYSTLPVPKELIPLLEIEGHEMVFSFIRSAYRGFDNKSRIHADGIINGSKTTMASVLYINEDNIGLNGTKFYLHEKYGRELPKDISNEEFDRLIKYDRSDKYKWKEQDFVVNVPNRLLLYNSNYFHAKWPNEITKGERIVLVTFYK